MYDKTTLPPYFAIATYVANNRIALSGFFTTKSVRTTLLLAHDFNRGFITTLLLIHDFNRGFITISIVGIINKKYFSKRNTKKNILSNNITIFVN